MGIPWEWEFPFPCTPLDLGTVARIYRWDGRISSFWCGSFSWFHGVPRITKIDSSSTALYKNNRLPFLEPPCTRQRSIGVAPIRAPSSVAWQSVFFAPPCRVGLTKRSSGSSSDVSDASVSSCANVAEKFQQNVTSAEFAMCKSQPLAFSIDHYAGKASRVYLYC